MENYLKNRVSKRGSKEIKSLYMPEEEIGNSLRMWKRYTTLKKHFKYAKLSESSMKIMFERWSFFI